MDEKEKNTKPGNYWNKNCLIIAIIIIVDNIYERYIEKLLSGKKTIILFISFFLLLVTKPEY